RCPRWRGGFRSRRRGWHLGERGSLQPLFVLALAQSSFWSGNLKPRRFWSPSNCRMAASASRFTGAGRGFGSGAGAAGVWLRSVAKPKRLGGGSPASLSKLGTGSVTAGESAASGVAVLGRPLAVPDGAGSTPGLPCGDGAGRLAIPVHDAVIA